MDHSVPCKFKGTFLDWMFEWNDGWTALSVVHDEYQRQCQWVITVGIEGVFDLGCSDKELFVNNPKVAEWRFEKFKDALAFCEQSEKVLRRQYESVSNSPLPE